MIGVMVYGKTRIAVDDVELGEREGRPGWYATCYPDSPILRSRMFYPKDMFEFINAEDVLRAAVSTSTESEQ
jgi:hypothetical protein